MSKAKKQAEPELDEALDEGPTVKLYGMELVPGQGWRTFVVQLPRSIVDLYAVETTEPELRGIAQGKLLQKMDADAFGGRS